MRASSPRPAPDPDAPEVDTTGAGEAGPAPAPPPRPSAGGARPSRLSRGSPRSRSGRSGLSARSGVSQAYAESETAFTTGIAVDLDALEARAEEDAAGAQGRFLDGRAVMRDIYAMGDPRPQLGELLRAPSAPQSAEAQLAWAEAEEAAGIPAYRQACAERSMHPSTVVIAALLRNQREISFSGAYLGALGMECVCAAIQSAFLKDVESLDLARAWISPVGLVHLASTLLGIEPARLADPGYAPGPEDKVSHDLKALDLSYNGLGGDRQLVLSDPEVLPMVSREAADYALSERRRVEGVLDKLRRGEPLEDEDPEEAKKAGKKGEGPVDPYKNAVRATALLGYARNNPRPFNPPPKLSAEEAKKRERGSAEVELPPDPTLADEAPLHEKLRRLNLRSVNLGQNALRILTAGCPGLTTLVLAGNELDDAFAADLVRALAPHESLLTLDLSRNAIGDPGAVRIAAEIPQFASIRELRLGDNRISHKGAAALAAGLCKAFAKGGMTLEALDLSGNKIGDRGGAFLLANVTTGGFASQTLAQEFSKALLEVVSTVAPIPPVFKQLKSLKPCEGFRGLVLERCGLGALSAAQACKLLPGTQGLQALGLAGNTLGGGLGLYGVLRALLARRDALGGAGALRRFTATLQDVDLGAQLPQGEGEGAAGEQPMGWEELWMRVRELAGDYVEELVIGE